jgi:F0F1-type ATP synthase assembly protein I
MKQLGHTIGLATELGITMGFSAASPVILGLVAGRWLDQQFGTKPILMMALMLTGVIGGQVAIYRLVISSARQVTRSAASAQPFAPMRRALRTLALVALSPLVGLALGLGLERWLGSGVMVAVALVVVGLALGMVVAVRRTLAPARRDPAEER